MRGHLRGAVAANPSALDLRESHLHAASGHAHVGGKRHFRSAAQHPALQRGNHRLLDVLDGGCVDHPVPEAPRARILGQRIEVAARGKRTLARSPDQHDAHRFVAIGNRTRLLQKSRHFRRDGVVLLWAIEHDLGAEVGHRHGDFFAHGCSLLLAKRIRTDVLACRCGHRSLKATLSCHDLSGIQQDHREDRLTNPPTAPRTRSGTAWRPVRGG